MISEVRWAVVATVCFLAGLGVDLLGGPAWPLYLACYLAGGWAPLLDGLRALREKTLDVDLLMVVAAIGAAAIGQVFDGGLLIVIFATSGALEAVATRRTANSVRDLVSGDELASSAEVGDVLLVRPGERIGADGEVVEGTSEVDQASITGEPLPVPKTAGDEVFAGTLNGTGALRVRVTRAAQDTVIARIVSMVEEASATKARTQLFIEKVEQWYSVGVVAATLALFFVPLAFGAALQPTLLRAMTFMIVASPCAVVLATMPPLLSAIANAGRHGVLVKSAVVMERLGTATRVAFDKTGTLTEGAPRVVEADDEVLRLAAAAEYGSEHPLGRAIVAAARERGLEVPAAQGFAAIPGVGVRAEVEGRQVRVGRGPTVYVDDVEVGRIVLTDRLREDAPAAVAALAEFEPVLLTGDGEEAAHKIAAEVGIADVRAELFPQDKVTAVRELGERVLLVGDGINDAPALAAAHVGVAVGRVDLALETADAVVVRDELTAIPAVIRLARRARRMVSANLVLAAACIAGLVLWDLLGDLPLPLGVAGHEGSTALVALNGLRLLRKSAWR
ncbi:heavy metal-(Cd/Co/Hg/Pb/Zn)-translocating P-type ATPase [Amycolatopsis bartoniae]|uniref:Metal-transporting ATPase n=1 Tax=Amycolatopsis bartoniae TaxID=941986 RepID=A0A8H9IUK5_9PSEU|nr:cadmium family heavy metal-translocating P-type ATPase [Amycolatopsis bartoniae]MBB2934756.1 heavy metal-(Cd/Co/Hg/Pb/Zn)-translocating P-type ATPase [Amycolatopsis bartoniae]TVT01182.1 cadmium-translocating P-type ATPase [Amycolatopsis bartoniae]GHF44989.1 metal-transporting ATPase [Amycolatopsis bartoniae]